MLGQPLPKEVLSSSVLGKLLLEDRVMKGDFLAPSAYLDTGTNVLKYKGPGLSRMV